MAIDVTCDSKISILERSSSIPDTDLSLLRNFLNEYVANDVNTNYGLNVNNDINTARFVNESFLSCSSTSLIYIRASWIFILI